MTKRTRFTGLLVLVAMLLTLAISVSCSKDDDKDTGNGGGGGAVSADLDAIAKGLIKRVVAGEKSIAALFTKEQEEFLAEMAGSVPDLAKLSILGPLMAQRWDFEDPACPWPITAELWTRADRATLMEVSVKAPAIQAAAVMAGFMAFLGEVGAERDVSQQAKTRWALDHYAARLRKTAAPRAATKPAGKRPRRKAT